MSNKTRELTLLRLKALADELSTIESEINVRLQRARDISAQLGDLSNSLRGMIAAPFTGDSNMVNRVQTPPQSASTYTQNGVKIRPGTIKDYVVQVLSESKRGMSALDILTAINERFGKDYDRTSLSPQLSRLRQDGVVGLRGPIWYLITGGGSIS